MAPPRWVVVACLLACLCVCVCAYVCALLYVCITSYASFLFSFSIIALRFSLLDSRSSILAPRFLLFHFHSSIFAPRFSLLDFHCSSIFNSRSSILALSHVVSCSSVVSLLDSRSSIFLASQTLHPLQWVGAMLITKYGSSLYIGMDEVFSHYASTFENSDLHFHFQ